MLAIETLANDIDDTMSHFESLVKIKNLVALESIDDTTNRIISNTISDIYNRLGIEYAKELSMESLTDNLKRIGEAILKAIKMMWSKITSVVNELLGTSFGLDAQISLLTERSKKINYKGEVSEVTELPMLLKSFSIDDKINSKTVLQIISASKILNDDNGKLIGEVDKLIQMVSHLDLEDSESFTGKEIIRQLSTIITTYNPSLLIGKRADRGHIGGKVLLQYGPFINDTFIVFTVSDVVMDLLLFTTKDSPSKLLVKAELNVKADSKIADKLTLANKKDLDSILKRCGELNEVQKAGKKNLAKIKKTLDDNTKLVEKSILSADEVVPEELKYNLDLTREIVKGVNSIVTVVSLIVPYQTNITISRSLRYAELSLKNLEQLDKG